MLQKVRRSVVLDAQHRDHATGRRWIFVLCDTVPEEISCDFSMTLSDCSCSSGEGKQTLLACSPLKGLMLSCLMLLQTMAKEQLLAPVTPCDSFMTTDGGCHSQSGTSAHGYVLLFELFRDQKHLVPRYDQRWSVVTKQLNSAKDFCNGGFGRWIVIKQEV